MISCVFKFIINILFGIYIVILGVHSLSNANSTLKKLENSFTFLGLKILMNYSREIMYGFQLTCIYTGFLFLFKARLTKFFGILFFLFKLCLLFVEAILKKEKNDTIMEMCLNLSILGGVLSI